MTQGSDPLPRARSLLLVVFAGVALSAVVMPSLEWLSLMAFHELPDPPSVWVDYLIIKVVSGACLGAAIYAAGRLFHGSPRLYLYSVLFFLLLGGDMEDYVSRSLGSFLTLWVGSSVLSGLLMGALLCWLQRRDRSSRVTTGE